MHYLVARAVGARAEHRALGPVHTLPVLSLVLTILRHLHQHSAIVTILSDITIATYISVRMGEHVLVRFVTREAGDDG